MWSMGLCLAVAVAVPSAAASARPTGARGPARSATTPVQGFTPGRVLFDVGIHPSATNAANGQGCTGCLSTFTNSVVDGAKTYSYTMVGSDPSIAGAGTTSIRAELIPLLMVLPNGDKFDPKVADSCDPGAKPLNRVESSPVFASQPWTWGATAVGTGQYLDAFQRANFWTYSQPGGISPNYGVSLGKVKVLKKIKIKVPSADAAEATGGPCGNGRSGAAEISWFDGYLQSTVLPSLTAAGKIGPGSFPIFLVHNFIEYQGSPTTGCCILGYHNASGSQTYAVADYDNSGFFAGASDVGPLSHEVGEWMDDPYTTNAARAWGHVGQVATCQSDLEVGDPLSGTTITDTVGGFSYHPQELAFFSWFFRQSPSLGVNGWYSDQGTFTTGAGSTCK